VGVRSGLSKGGDRRRTEWGKAKVRRVGGALEAVPRHPGQAWVSPRAPAGTASAFPADAHRLRPVGQIVAPELPVVGKLLGRAIGGVLFQEMRERTERPARPIMIGASGAELGIYVGDAAGAQPQSVAIPGPAMVPSVPN